MIQLTESNVASSMSLVIGIIYDAPVLAVKCEMIMKLRYLHLCVSGEAVVDMASWVTNACDWTEHWINDICYSIFDISDI